MCVQPSTNEMTNLLERRRDLLLNVFVFLHTLYGLLQMVGLIFSLVQLIMKAIYRLVEVKDLVVFVCYLVFKLF